MKLRQIEALARVMVGDGKAPNVFFVSTKSDGVVLVSRSFIDAYECWMRLPRDIESSLEDRRIGLIASVEPVNEDGTGRLIVVDSSLYTFRRDLARHR